MAVAGDKKSGSPVQGADVSLLAEGVSASRTEPIRALRATREFLQVADLKPGLRSDALKAQAVALFAAGNGQAALECIQDAVAAAREATDPARQARCLVNLGAMLGALDRWDEAMDAYEGAVRLVGPESEVAAIASSNIGLIAEAAGEDELALHFHRQAYPLLARSSARASAALNCGITLHRLDRLSEARVFLVEAAGSAGSDPPQLYQLNARIALAWLEAREGRADAAVAQLSELLRVAESLGQGNSALRARALLGQSLFLLGRHAEAIEIGEACREVASQQAPSVAPELDWWLAKAYAAVGRPDRASVLLIQREERRLASLASESNHAVRRKLFALALQRGGCSPVAASSGPKHYVVEPAVAQAHALTARESEVLLLVAMGMTNNEIAMATRLSPNTVRNRLAGAMRKLSVSTRSAAARRILEIGLIRSSSEQVSQLP